MVGFSLGLPPSLSPCLPPPFLSLAQPLALLAVRPPPVLQSLQSFPPCVSITSSARTARELRPAYMEAAEETLTYRDVTRLHRKLLPGDKERDNTDSKDTKSNESNYVDLDVKPGGAKTVKVTFTGDGNQLSVVKGDSEKQRKHNEDGELISGDAEDEPGTVPEPVRELPDADQDSDDENRRRAQAGSADRWECAYSGSDELRYTDMYLNSRTESDDGASAVLSDHCGSDTAEDESHYITTHEIQLTELDHDVDYDLGRGTCWDFDDNNLVYSFVDYASFESDDTQEGTLVAEGRSQAKMPPGFGGAVVSTEQEDSDLCDSDKCASSDETGGGIHLSIKTSSRAVNEPVGAFDDSTKDFGDRSHFFVSSGARSGPLCDRAQHFIPAPGRQHLATKLRRKDINEYSSGASSSISELDDADKEVRNLTAKSFRSLACPYFDAINLSTSSESSISEYGLNKWSAYVDWNYGNMSRGGERSVITHKTSSATLEMSKTVDAKRAGKSMKAPQTKMYVLHKRTTSEQSSSSELKDAAQPNRRGLTLNLHCRVEEADGARRPKCSKKGTAMARSGCEMQHHHTDSTGGTHKRAVFASSLLKNVISKKMQFEQERKMERGEICDTYPALSPCFQHKDLEGRRERSEGRARRRQSFESGSGFNSADDQHSRSSSCETAEELEGYNVPDDSEKSKLDPPRALLSHSHSSAFNSLKEDETKPVREVDHMSVSDTQTREDPSSMQSKLLFVPSCQLLSTENSFPEDLPRCAPVTAECEKEEKTPEIKICLRSVKENKGCTLNIANLLTPKIRYNTVNTLRTPGDAKCHVSSASDKIPNFTVRDIRDTKCKFQTPIYHVRDVRKLVKSSYRFVSLDNADGKCSTAADKPEEKATKEPLKHSLPTPIVIKCQSVNTNVKQQTAEASQSRAGIPSDTRQNENTLLHCTGSRMPNVAKQQHSEPSEIQPNSETKLVKQRLEQFETAERRNEPTIPKQAALEKLKAAVKTMEQLYIFDRNEWKRKTQAPQPVTDSHVLSLIASEEKEAEEVDTTKNDRIPHQKSMLHVGNKACVSISSVSNSISPNSTLQTSLNTKSSTTPVAPLSVKIEHPKNTQEEKGKIKIIPTHHSAKEPCLDSENYLTIPGLANTDEIESVSLELNSNGNQIRTAEQKMSPLIMEYPASGIYHHSGAAKALQAQQQVLCFSPTFTALSPTPSAGDTVSQTQRKMLLDPTTGHYYLVDTPIQPTTKRLFDPETGQYVDVPMPHSPVTPVSPVTHVPLSLSPLAFSPRVYTPTYMVYPGYIPSPTLQAKALLPQCRSEDALGEKVKHPTGPRPETAATGSESAYYSATGEGPQGPLHLPVSLGHVTTRGGPPSSERKPVISITTQQGPRIIAPPSFDGTTMSFVVEHR
uniref:DUF4585 domain-containing protein n=1 Tax=Mola mola TaxID=94237 RepID=A0A3Q4AW39_MOLML